MSARGPGSVRRPVAAALGGVTIVLMGLISGCGGDGDADAVAEYDRRMQRIDESVTSVVGQVLDEVGGQRRGTGLGAPYVCGLGPPFSGVEYEVTANDRGLSIAAALSTATRELARAFADDDWTLGSVTDSGFEGTLDGDMTVRVRTGPGGLMLTVSTGCVDMSSDTAEDVADRPRKEYRF